MPERNLDFDTVIDRRNTFCLKYDFAVERGKAKPGEDTSDLIPLWIADMDFKTSSYIQDALVKAMSSGIYGYSETKEDYFLAVQNFYRTHHQFEIENSSWMIKTPGVMMMLGLAMNAFTEKGDGILIQSPVYMHFSEEILAGKRRVISNDLVYGEDGRFHIDFDDFEKKIIEEKPKLFFLCSPHNPVSRVWTREELERMTSICLKHHVKIVSDEIHSDFVFTGKHIPTATISKEVADNTITVTSPTKTFNLAGLQIAHTFISNEKMRKAILQELDAIGYSQVSLAGIVGAYTAYTQGDTWLQAMIQYVKENIEFTAKFIDENLPGIKMVPMEASYLALFDFRGTGKKAEEIDEIILHKARLWLNSGSLFGKNGQGFERVNLACPRSVLSEALTRLQRAFYS